MAFLSQRKYRGFCEVLGYKAAKYGVELTAGIQFNAEQIALVKALALQAKNKSTAPR